MDEWLNSIDEQLADDAALSNGASLIALRVRLIVPNDS